jgi:hypothetical protein
MSYHPLTSAEETKICEQLNQDENRPLSRKILEETIIRLACVFNERFCSHWGTTCVENFKKRHGYDKKTGIFAKPISGGRTKKIRTESNLTKKLSPESRKRNMIGKDSWTTEFWQLLQHGALRNSDPFRNNTHTKALENLALKDHLSSSLMKRASNLARFSFDDTFIVQQELSLSEDNYQGRLNMACQPQKIHLKG